MLGAMLAIAPVAATLADGAGPVLHEPIPPDPAEDLAMHVSLPGHLPPAIRTSKGKLGAPDPQEPPSPTEPAYAGDESDRLQPDRDTRRPAVSGYDDPFTPSTAPFKRLIAFDTVLRDYTLAVRDGRQVPMTEGPAAGADDDSFYADMLVDLTPGRRVRIPSVGPGARIVHGRLGDGAEELPLRVLRDGADNWFLDLDPSSASPLRGRRRARLVMELAIARRAFGGDFADARWADLPLVPPLPDPVARDAAIVQGAIGVSRQLRPREAVAKLVQYFRSFTESNDPPKGWGSVYLDLALSRKGVCRHRAFAFLVTAQSLGIPTRMVMNEAHAWVEVHDGTLYRRIDLGGAGRMDGGSSADRIAYEPPPDAFRWPVGAKRGTDMMSEARAGGAGGSRAAPGAAASAVSPALAPTGAPLAPSPASTEAPASAHARVQLEVLDPSPHRGDPLHVRGVVSTDGHPCDHVTVDVWLASARRNAPPAASSPGAGADARTSLHLGTLATDDRGAFEGTVMLPADAPLGDYDVVATSAESGRCDDGDAR
jgi:transglutaminase-like putative cysteine protease